MADVQGPTTDKRAREGRSPAFPFLDLPKALERAEQLRVAEGRHLVPVGSATKAWKLGEASGSGRRTVAALGHYGLLDDEGAGSNRKVRLSDLALKILLDRQPISPERDELVKRAALNPPIHRELWERWRHELPSQATMETYLIRDRGFSSSGASELVAEYRSTLAFAKLDETAIMPLDPEAQADLTVNEGRTPIKAGDFVQWTNQGSDQFKVPPQVIAVSDDGQWLWVQGDSKAAIPMTQVQVVQPPGSATSPSGATLGGPPPPPPAVLASQEASRKPTLGMKEDRNSLDEGEAILIWPETLSADSVHDLEYWLLGVLKKAKRRAGIVDSAPTGKDEAAH